MGRYFVQRLVQAVPVLLGVALISFCLTELSGDPVRGLLGQSTRPEIVAKVREFYGYDKPAPERFARYLWRLARGDLGASISNHGLPVTQLLLDGLKVTVKLALGAMIVAVGLGLLSGIVSAWRPRSVLDYASSAAAAAGISFPAFFLAMLFLMLFAVRLRWFPVGGYEEGRLEYLILPSLSLGLIMTASVSRLSRNCLLETLSQDYTRTARAKGLTPCRVLLGHALPNALVPVVTVIGNDFAGLLCGAVLTETVYGLPGIGSALNRAIFERDLPVVMGTCLVMAVIFVVTNLLVDLTYAVLDPRIRYAE